MLTNRSNVFLARKIAPDIILSSTDEFDFTSINQNFTNLRIKVFARSNLVALNDDLIMFFGGNTSATSYRYGSSSGGSTVGNVSADGAFIGKIPGASATAGYFGVVTIIIPLYSQTNFEKVSTSTGGYRLDATTADTWQHIHFSETTQAVSRIRIRSATHPTTKLIAGSVAQLYGIL